MKITLSIPRLPQSGNQTRKFSGWERQAYRDLWHQEVWVACRKLEPHNYWTQADQLARGLPYPKAKVTITLYFKDKRRRDEDNMRQGLKYAVDGLVAAGIIEDDEWYPTCKCKVELVGKYDKEHPRVEIEVEEVR